MGKIKEILLVYLKGIGMGGADVVPGVSGGTIAFITGIYERLLNAIKAVDLEALKLLSRFEIKQFWNKIDGKFLLPLFLGIVTSLKTLAQLITYLMTNHPIPLWSFFFGLIIISAVLVLRAIKVWHFRVVLAGIIGIAIAYLVTILSPAETPDSLWFIFISGAIAICAMILPGISGSFILLILGKYEYIIQAVNGLHIVTLIVFASGCVVGLLSFVRVVSWLLNRYHDMAIALLSGFMIGSLNKVWPWKIPILFRVNSKGDQVPYITENVWPAEYFKQLGDDPKIFLAILFTALGVFMVVIVERMVNYKNKISG